MPISESFPGTTAQDVQTMYLALKMLDSFPREIDAPPRSRTFLATYR